MSDINDIRALMKIWKERTFKDEIDYLCEGKDETDTLYPLYISVIKLQHLENKKMDGYSVEKLPIKYEGNTDVIFTNVFEKTVCEYFSPGSYIIDLIRECKEKGISKEYEVAGIIGRGYRSFPSFIRELDLSYKVSEALPTAECIRVNPENDVADHTDVVVKYENSFYRLWSYQNTWRGLDNTSSRLSENRGSIPFGIHVLCPFDGMTKGQYEELNGWRFYNKETIEKIADLIKGNKIDDYSNIRKMDRESLKRYMKYSHIFSKSVKENIDMSLEARRIINCIFIWNKSRMQIRKSDLLDFVLEKRSLSNDIYEKIKIEGRNRDEIELLVNQMISEGLISQSADYYHTLKLENYDCLKDIDKKYYLKKY